MVVVTFLVGALVAARQRAGVHLYVWVLDARNAVTAYLRSRRETPQQHERVGSLWRGIVP